MGTLEIVGAGWRGGVHAVRQNIPLFAVTFIVMIGIASIFQPMFPAWHAHHQSHVVKPINLHLWLASTFQDVFDSLAAAPSMIAVHRFILLNEHSKVLHDVKRIIYFAVLITTFHLLPLLPGLFMGRIELISIILGFGIYYCMPRLVMSFPALAIDINNPIADRWRRARGHWWTIVGVIVIGFLLLLAPVLLMIGANEATRIAVAAILSSMTPLVGAGLASELYRNFGGLTRSQV